MDCVVCAAMSSSPGVYHCSSGIPETCAVLLAGEDILLVRAGRRLSDPVDLLPGTILILVFGAGLVLGRVSPMAAGSKDLLSAGIGAVPRPPAGSHAGRRGSG